MITYHNIVDIVVIVSRWLLFQGLHYLIWGREQLRNRSCYFKVTVMSVSVSNSMSISVSELKAMAVSNSHLVGVYRLTCTCPRESFVVGCHF